MEVRSVDIVESPSDKSRVRLVSEIAYDDRPWEAEVYWFEVPEPCSEFLSNSGNPWLACLLPLAVTIGEPLRIRLPVDRLLFENAHELMLIWKNWYPQLRTVPVEVELYDAIHEEGPSKTASFFSGGVDSFFTVLRHSNGSNLPARIDVDDLICIWGFDIPIADRAAFGRLEGTLRESADRLGKELVSVATNIRETRWWSSGYGILAHGAGLASIALALEEMFNKVLIPSSYPYGNLVPNGSHPMTDPLLSTSRTKLIHDGAGYNRVEKTALIARSEIALDALRVCWQSQSDRNCQACSKCYRTMITLMLLDVLHRCKTFDAHNLDLRKIPKIYLDDEGGRVLIREVQVLAAEKGREDIARAIDRSLKRSARLEPCMRIIQRYKSLPLVWRLENWILRNSLI